MIKNFLMGLVAATLLCCVSTEALAQRRARVPGFRSAPTVSPYVTVRGNFGGPVGAYFGFIQPREQLGQFINQQNASTNAMLRDQAQIQQSLSQLNSELTQGQFGGVPTGGTSFTTAGYMNYRQYFHTFRQPSRRR